MKIGDITEAVTILGGPRDGDEVRMRWAEMHRLVTWDGMIYKLRDEVCGVIEEDEDIMGDVLIAYFYECLGFPKPMGNIATP